MRGIMNASEVSAMICLESTASRAVRALNIKQSAIGSNLPNSRRIPRPAHYTPRRKAIGTGMSTKTRASIIDACGDPELFARWFREKETWRSWFVFLRAL